MVKKDEPGAGDPAPSRKQLARRRRRAERRLGAARELEARRARQLDEARDLRIRREAELAALGAEQAIAQAAPSADDPDADQQAGSDGPIAYCLRERQKVRMANPTPLVLRSGRAALAGTCPSCGARLVVTTGSIART